MNGVLMTAMKTARRNGLTSAAAALRPGDDDDERGRREQDGLKPRGMVFRGVHRAERCRRRAGDATGGRASVL